MKCNTCGGCRKAKWIDNKVYLVCFLCLRIWRATGEEVLDEERVELFSKLDIGVVE